jgi:hypothetical protein
MLRVLVGSLSRLFSCTSSHESRSNAHPAVSAFSAPPRYISKIFGHRRTQLLTEQVIVRILGRTQASKGLSPVTHFLLLRPISIVFMALQPFEYPSESDSICKSNCLVPLTHQSELVSIRLSRGWAFKLLL